MNITRFAIGMVLVVSAASAAGAQNPPGGAPPTPQGRGRGGGRGGGRGRAVAVMTLTSIGFKDGESMPKKYSQAGEELSPPLAWSGAPDSAKSFVLIVHDLDGAVGTNGTDDVLHWLAWNIPGTSRSLPQGVSQGPELPDGTRQISVSGPYYRGPAAPATGPVHHYLFELYALDSKIDVPPVATTTATGRGGAPPTTRAVTPSETRAAILTAMSGHIRGKAVLVGLFRRPAG